MNLKQIKDSVYQIKDSDVMLNFTDFPKGKWGWDIELWSTLWFSWDGKEFSMGNYTEAKAAGDKGSISIMNGEISKKEFASWASSISGAWGYNPMEDVISDKWEDFIKDLCSTFDEKPYAFRTFMDRNMGTLDLSNKDLLELVMSYNNQGDGESFNITFPDGYQQPVVVFGADDIAKFL